MGNTPKRERCEPMNGTTESWVQLVNRIRMEYLEMPGLTLTKSQARRLWNLESTECDAVLSTLVAERFLAEGQDGTFLRRSAA
jgi:hypothetical protein